MNPASTFNTVTASGALLNYEKPTADMIDLRANAHELSMICRWGGNVHFQYSVAQHSIVVADNIPVPEWRIYGLLHDAAEPYIGDICTPFKGWLAYNNADVHGVERRILNCVWEKLGIPKPTAEISKGVHLVDQQVLATEYRDVVKSKSPDWTPPAPPLSQRITFKRQDKVLDQFVSRLNTYSAMAKVTA